MTPIDIACPSCKAAAGQDCHVPLQKGVAAGWVRVKSNFHADRERALQKLQCERARIPQNLRPAEPQAVSVENVAVIEWPVGCTCSKYPFAHHHESQLRSRG